jgi:DNA-directed RNA polymerase subunit beta
MNMRLDLDAEDTVRVLRKEDILAVVKTLVELRDGKGEIDDIDNLGNRRVRSVGELMENQYRVGLLRMERAIKERMSSIEIDTVMPQDLINAKPAAAAVREFFGSSQLSQFMDQTNPLSEITHKRRLSALGPGGLTRERAGFEVRDVHPTHYGRICPIETPEGPNIGLINSLATFARVNKYGFIESPYRKIATASHPTRSSISRRWRRPSTTSPRRTPSSTRTAPSTDELVICRHAGEVMMVPRDNVDLMDVSPKQIVSVAAALIPFLENDDANRALMGSNMQRQAVPLVRAEAPFVGTGMEPIVARDSGAAIAARRAGVVDQVDATRIVIRATEDLEAGKSGVDIYRLMKFQRSNQNTCINQRPLVKWAIVEQGRHHRRRPVDRSRRSGARPQRARRVHAVERLQLRGLDPALRADRGRRRLHLDPHRGVRGHGPRHQARSGGNHARHSERVGRGAEEPRRGRHRLHRRGSAAGRHPGRQDHAEGREPDDAGREAAARHLRREGVRRARHLDAHAARERSAPSSRCASSTATASRRTSAPWRSSARRSSVSPRTATTSRRSSTATSTAAWPRCWRQGPAIAGPKGFKKGSTVISKEVLDEYPAFAVVAVRRRRREAHAEIEALRGQYDDSKKALEQRFMDKVEKVQRGDEMPPGVMKMVKVFVAVKRKIQPGDKMAGRHGNKGVVSRIVPVEDMPFLEDGTHVDIVLNPLGVPSRMNVGQILETHLGWACAGMGRKIGEMIEAYKQGAATSSRCARRSRRSCPRTTATSRSRRV